jgi:hypothetical protein
VVEKKAVAARKVVVEEIALDDIENLFEEMEIVGVKGGEDETRAAKHEEGEFGLDLDFLESIERL